MDALFPLVPKIISKNKFTSPKDNIVQSAVFVFNELLHFSKQMNTPEPETTSSG
jgi:hypothetical protein